MTTTTPPPGGPPRRPRALVGALAAAAVLAGGGAWLNSALAGPPREPAPAAAPSPTTAPPPPTTPASSDPSHSPETAGGSGGAGPLTEDAAAEVITAAAAVPLAEHETDEELARRFADLASGAYLAELEAQWQELLANGWTIEGAPEVVSAEIEREDREARSAVVLGCLDSSGVVTRDAAGDPIGPPDARAARALHRFTLTEGEDDVWRVSRHDFPDDPAC